MTHGRLSRHVRAHSLGARVAVLIGQSVESARKILDIEFQLQDLIDAPGAPG